MQALRTVTQLTASICAYSSCCHARTGLYFKVLLSSITQDRSHTALSIINLNMNGNYITFYSTSSSFLESHKQVGD